MPRRFAHSDSELPNIQKRINPLSTSYRVRIRLKTGSVDLTFYSEEEARDWLNDHYYNFLKDPSKYKKSKKLIW